MRRMQHRHRHPPAKVGAPPGTLIHIGERKAERSRIRLMAYDGEKLSEKDLESVDGRSCRDESTVVWLNIDGIHDISVIEAAGRCFGIHPLVQEDILNTAQRPKMEEYENYLFLVVKMLQTDPAGGIRTEQVSIVLGSSFVLSFQEMEGDVFDRIRERLRTGKGRIRKLGADYLAYALLDSIIDRYFLILEDLGDRIEALEEELILHPTPPTLRKIHQFKREMIHLRKSIWPLREVLGSLQRQEPPLMQESTRIYLRDVYDHTIQIVDTVETYRDIIAGMLDLYLSSLSHRTNEVMKVLTIIATIFIPLTFIAGVYGMNFDYMPELHWKWSYPILWGLMVLTVLGMLWYFRRKKWL